MAMAIKDRIYPLTLTAFVIREYAHVASLYECKSAGSEVMSKSVYQTTVYARRVDGKLLCYSRASAERWPK